MKAFSSVSRALVIAGVGTDEYMIHGNHHTAIFIIIVGAKYIKPNLQPTRQANAMTSEAVSGRLTYANPRHARRCHFRSNRILFSHSLSQFRHGAR